MKRTLLTAILAFIAILGMNAQEYEYTVKDTQISREEFFEAYQHRFEYNQIRDTTLDWHTKKCIEVAVFRTLTDEEKEAYIWTDYGIDKIGRFPTGEYIANLAYIHWVGAVFLNKDFRPDSTVIQANDCAVYSKSGIYVGCEGFDCDNHARLHFYTHRGNAPSEMKEIAVYINNKWRLPWDETEYPEFEGLDFYMPMVWYKDALYCAAMENYDDENGKWCTRPIFLKLELVKHLIQQKKAAARLPYVLLMKTIS